MQDHSGQFVEKIHDRLLGNYRILRLLGQGSFADVYLGEHIHLHTQAAIKVLQVRLVENNIQGFLNEARTIAHLVHPYIVRVLDFGVEANMPFLVMDYAPRGTFRQRFLRGRPLPPTALFPFIKQAASALQYAHDKKLIHRDVKPENMLLGPTEEILLSDFGFAVIQTSLTRPSVETAGTASYMAPEQFQGKPQPASDQYSLGVIAYEWLTGTCPFQGTFMELASQHMMAPPPSLIRRVPGLSAQVAQVVMTALAKEPEERFPSVRDFARALEHACLNSSNHVTVMSPIMPPPFLAPPSDLHANYPSLPHSSQDSLPILPIEHQQSGKAQIYPQLSQNSPVSPLSTQSFLPAVTTGQPEPAQTLSSLEIFRQVPTPPPSSSSTFPALPQLKPAEQPFLPPASPSQSHQSLLPALPQLPQQPFLTPELARLDSPDALIPQTFPTVQHTSIRTRALSHNTPAPNGDSSPQLEATAVNQPSTLLSASNDQSPQLVRAEDFRRTAKSSTSGTLRIFVILMVVLIIGSTATLVVLTNNQHRGLKSTSANQQATPRTNIKVTSTPQTAKQTPTSQGTPQPTAQTTTVPNPYGDHNGVLVLNNPLNQQDQQVHWDESPGTCAFNTDGYHVVAGPQSQGFTLCNAATTDYTNFAYEAQMTFTKVTAPTASGGLAFRGNKTNHQFYFFEIFTTGTYALYRCPGQNGGPCPLLSATPTGGGPMPSFHTNLNQPNTIAVLANGNTFSFYVNNQLAVGPLVDTVTDPNYTHGTIGMIARQNTANAMTDVAFSNVKIWKI